MKKSPQTRKLEHILRSSKLVAGGFLGDDSRSFTEVIEADASQVSRLGYTMEQIAARMQEITDTAKTGLGNWVTVDDKLQAVAEEAKGSLICPCHIPDDT